MNKTRIVLLLLILLPTFFIISFPYPIGEENNRFTDKKTWTGGTIPDEKAYYGWAQIYYETHNIYLPLEEVGPPKIQHIDFYIGENPSKCVFTDIKVEKQQQWETKTRSIIIRVFNGYNQGIPGISIEVKHKGHTIWSNTTNNKGLLVLHGIPPGLYRILIKTPSKPIDLTLATDYRGLNYPIEVTATPIVKDNNIEVLIHVNHSINGNLSNVKLYYGKPSGEPIGVTDDNGNYLLHLLESKGLIRITAVKETLGFTPPLGSGVVEVNGRYGFANHWPPGYSLLLIPFWVSKTILYLLPLLLNLILISSTYLLARKLYSNGTGLLAAIIVAFSPIGLMMLYSRGMADHASTTLATLGVTLYIYSMDSKRNMILGLAGGLVFASAVTMRYSTIVVLLAPLTYTLILIYRRNPREMLDRFLYYLKKGSPFIVGLLVIGGLLAYYNTILFGGPLNSGYQTSRRIMEENNTIIIEEPSETMFQHYFHPSMESIQNLLDRILPQLFYMLPVLYILPLTFSRWKRKETWFLWMWILPILVIYMQLSWVGKIPMEDMRYFLPVLPPAAILVADTLQDGKPYMKITIVSLFISTGILMSYHAINWQINRRLLGLVFNPPLLALVLL
ncbi:MAG TPA: hypothetical protein ENG62_02745, partial [Thermoplasmatales archaeon]|nr:hypothetical protein [Thermoplasmatales archaeon]